MSAISGCLQLHSSTAGHLGPGEPVWTHGHAARGHTTQRLGSQAQLREPVSLCDHPQHALNRQLSPGWLCMPVSALHSMQSWSGPHCSMHAVLLPVCNDSCNDGRNLSKPHTFFAEPELT